MNKILVIGDLHFKEFLSYGDYIKDKRVAEKESILKFIVSEAKDCDSIVLMGDNFDHRNNSAEVVRSFVEFIEKFGNKDVYILSGNHEKKGDGKTAIDFLKEVKKSNWHIFTKITSGYEMQGIRVDFVPFMLKSELEVETDEEAAKEIMKRCGDGSKILFHHHVVSGSLGDGGLSTEMFREIVLPREELEKKYNLIIGGHIHFPHAKGKVVVTGSIFNNQVGEIEKCVWKIDPNNLLLEPIGLPGRKIYSFINPTDTDLSKLSKSSIIKVVITDREADIEKLKKNLESFDAHILIEQYPNKRNKVHFEEGALDLDIENLLKIYSEEKKVDLSSLIKGWKIIK